jgi:hypothetical protein
MRLRFWQGWIKLLKKKEKKKKFIKQHDAI